MLLKPVFFFTVILVLSISTSFGEVNPVYELNIAKGVQKFNVGDYNAAGDAFEEALKAVPGDIKATLFLGIVRSKQKRYNEAEVLLKRVLDSGKELPRAHYELGLIAYKKHEYTEAKEHLKKAGELSTDIELNKAIDQLLLAIESARPVKRYGLIAMIGSQYDSNVVYISDTVAIEREDKEDIRGVFYGKASWRPIDSRVKTIFEYSFYQSLHSNLTDFNLQIHELTAFVDLDIAKKFSLQGKYSFEYTYLGGDRYSKIHLVSPSILIEWKKGFVTRLFYEYRSKAFWDTTISYDSENREADNNLFGIEQKIPLGRNAGFKMIYSSEKNSARADYWSYGGNRVEGSLYYNYLKWHLDLKGEYYDKKYEGPYPGLLIERHDKAQTYSASIGRSFTQNISIRLSQSFIRNSSNLELYDYDRAITGLFLIAMF